MESTLFIIITVFLTLAVGFAGWAGWHFGFREGQGEGFKLGHGQAMTEVQMERQRVRVDARRYHDERPDSAGDSRVSQMRFRP